MCDRRPVQIKVYVNAEALFCLLDFLVATICIDMRFMHTFMVSEYVHLCGACCNVGYFN
jgi:hypothetical protein